MARVKVTIEVWAEEGRHDSITSIAEGFDGAASKLIPRAAQAAVETVLYGAAGVPKEDGAPDRLDQVSDEDAEKAETPGCVCNSAGLVEEWRHDRFCPYGEGRTRIKKDGEEDPTGRPRIPEPFPVTQPVSVDEVIEPIERDVALEEYEALSERFSALGEETLSEPTEDAS